MDNISDRATKAAHATAETVSHGIHEAADTAGRVADNLGKKGEQIMESQEKMLNECSGWIRKNPMTAVAVAAGLGYVVSKLTR
jgi:ElaB/YqjD/DUF883 family membrane-anchored ribosome-binding protein